MGLVWGLMGIGVPYNFHQLHYIIRYKLQYLQYVINYIIDII